MRVLRQPVVTLSGAIAMTWLLSGCTTIAFGVANLPTYFSGIQRHAGIAYGADPRQRLDVYQPKAAAQPVAAAATATAAAAGAKPVIVFWYGGSWDDGKRQDYRFVGVALARLGYVSVIPDYRLYPQVRFPLFLQDGAQAVAWVQQHAAEYGGDPQRLVLMGHSAGAHMAAMLALNRHYLEAAGADPRRIIALIGLSGPYGLTPNTAKLHDIFGPPFTPHDWQVLPYASPLSPPALLLHGGADKLVWVSNTEDLAAALRAHGVAVETRIYPNRGHVDMLAAISLPGRRRAPVLADIAAYLRTLDGNGAPMSAAAPPR
jgi:acetyl esterase/lipase